MIRFCGNSKPLFWIATFTRSRASRTALSPRPTIWNAGSPRWRSTSTVTRRDSIPSIANVVTRASTSERAFEVVERDEAALAVDGHADRVEAQIARARAVVDLGEVGRAHAAHLL